MYTILSYRMGMESTAILVRWLEDAYVRPCPLEILIVITAHTGESTKTTSFGLWNDSCGIPTGPLRTRTCAL